MTSPKATTWMKGTHTCCKKGYAQGKHARRQQPPVLKKNAWRGSSGYGGNHFSCIRKN